jgi:phage baseplate assembly protein gpV
VYLTQNGIFLFIAFEYQQEPAQNRPSSFSDGRLAFEVDGQTGTLALSLWTGEHQLIVAQKTLGQDLPTVFASADAQRLGGNETLVVVLGLYITRAQGPDDSGRRICICE